MRNRLGWDALLDVAKVMAYNRDIECFAARNLRYSVTSFGGSRRFGCLHDGFQL